MPVTTAAIALSFRETAAHVVWQNVWARCVHLVRVSQHIAIGYLLTKSSPTKSRTQGTLLIVAFRKERAWPNGRTRFADHFSFGWAFPIAGSATNEMIQF